MKPDSSKRTTAKKAWTFASSAVIAGLIILVPRLFAGQSINPNDVPAFLLAPAPPLVLPSLVDSNSPAFWQFAGGRNLLRVVTSWGNPSMTEGVSIRRLHLPEPVRFSTSANGGRWMESILQADNGTLYGYYHHEPLGLCVGKNKTAPRIGAARSTDDGATWEDLGIIIDAPAALDCSTPNEYFAGGAGDFTAVLDQNETDVYFFFTNYTGSTTSQGVATARMPWAQRDAPQGNIAIWDGRIWRNPPRTVWQFRRGYFDPKPIYPTLISWHDPSGTVDAFWGPSIHWNTAIQQYVLLLNRASDSKWSQEGIYISFSPVLDDPQRWTSPIKILDGDWYPQVIGLERERGTDKVAGAVSRIFIRGRSEYFLIFPEPKSPERSGF
jgi:hypothetical protein